MFDIFRGIPKDSIKIEYNEYKNEYLVYVWRGLYWSAIDKYGNFVEFDTVGSMLYYFGSIWKEEVDSSEINDWAGVFDRVETYYIRMQEKQADKHKRELKDKWVQVNKEIIPFNSIPDWLKNHERVYKDSENE